MKDAPIVQILHFTCKIRSQSEKERKCINKFFSKQNQTLRATNHPSTTAPGHSPGGQPNKHHIFDVAQSLWSGKMLLLLFCEFWKSILTSYGFTACFFIVNVQVKCFAL